MKTAFTEEEKRTIEQAMKELPIDDLKALQRYLLGIQAERTADKEE